MQQFSNSEIDEAKKRVREMQQRTRAVSENEGQTDESVLNVPLFESLVQVLSPLKNSDKMSPLALLALLSSLKENDDKTLILALIYILL